MAKLAYTRILLKVSGEQLAGPGGRGFDPKVGAWMAKEIAAAVDTGAEVAVVVGGGNYVRGNEVAGGDLTNVTSHYMGMLSTMINAIALGDIFNANSVPAAVLSTVAADYIVDLYTQRRAVHHLSKGRVVILGGGLGRPFVTTDTGAVALALELDCDAVVKVTKVDGVYDKDPAKHNGATRLHKVTFQQAVEDPNLRVMDKAALGMAMENEQKIVVCDLASQDNIRRLVLGEDIGTVIS
jgi:uridylate kinase